MQQQILQEGAITNPILKRIPHINELMNLVIQLWSLNIVQHLCVIFAFPFLIFCSYTQPAFLPKIFTVLTRISDMNLPQLKQHSVVKFRAVFYDKKLKYIVKNRSNNQNSNQKINSSVYSNHQVILMKKPTKISF